MNIQLSAQKRDVFGSKLKKIRQNGLISAELYGRGIDNVHLSVAGKDFKDAFEKAGETSVVYLNFDNESRPALIYDIHRHPVSGDILSVDFYQVRMDEKVQAYVPVEIIGEAPAVKDHDGTLLTVMKEVEVEALPADMPHDFKVDIAVLKEIDDAIKVKDLNVPQNVKILAELDSTIVMVKAKMTEEEEKALEAEGADASVVEVEGEKIAEASDEEKAEIAKEEAQED